MVRLGKIRVYLMNLYKPPYLDIALGLRFHYDFMGIMYGRESQKSLAIDLIRWSVWVLWGRLDAFEENNASP